MEHGTLTGKEENHEEKTKFIICFLDQWRYQAMGYAKEDEVCTPHMDSFAREA